MKNLNLLFNKCYYEEIAYKGEDGNIATPDFISSIKRHNATLFESKLTQSEYAESPLKGEEGFVCFVLKTTYPGLMVGTGYAHGSGLQDADVDINCGFSFEYVTGQPYLPGSSVKGILRSAFQHPDVIKQTLKKQEWGLESVAALEEAIFGSRAQADGGTDVFLDAVVKEGDTNNFILGSETITPHPKDIFKDPTPIQMLKVLPNVKLEFRFILQDAKIGDEVITTQEKKLLFKEILKLLGVGAKTNVGFGSLIEMEETIPEVVRPALESVLQNGVSRTVAGSAFNTQSAVVRRMSPVTRQNAGKGELSSRGKYCPNCAAFNFRCKKDSQEETPMWKKGICYKCRGKL